ncbi:Protein SPIRRIG [Frankliniella fusca]|uniref:Protein SPIRRIG n=1 Tax=Frankliniella fusca TaxID=407009 RepID=A0AAE1HMK6_9NEOP|nr:Protein SPIRRIG [Frankliniella fusca]
MVQRDSCLEASDSKVLSDKTIKWGIFVHIRSYWRSRTWAFRSRSLLAGRLNGVLVGPQQSLDGTEDLELSGVSHSGQYMGTLAEGGRYGSLVDTYNE